MNYIYERLQELSPLYLQEECESINLILQNNMDYVESKCRKIHTGSISWSPTYNMVNLLLNYWRMRRSYKLGMHKNFRQLIVLQNKIKIPYNNLLTLDEITTHIKSVHKKRKDIKENS